VVDLSHQNLTDDIEGFLPSYFQANPWDDWSKYDAHSPIRFVQNVKTPVMLQHGEADQRVPFSNAVMFYNALRRRNVPGSFACITTSATWSAGTAYGFKNYAKQC
jgi:dipeptidyl aminopeptidase/acylaminoacyl peptidase